MNRPTYNPASTPRAAMAALYMMENPSVRSAVKYLAPDLVVKVTRKAKPSFRDKRHVEFVVSIGRPNHDERKLIKLCLKAGELFPVKKVQIKRYKAAR